MRGKKCKQLLSWLLCACLMMGLLPVSAFAGISEYIAIYTGLCPMYGGVVVPWTTPVIISGF